MVSEREKVVSTRPCDNLSVGVIVRNSDGKFAILKRAKFPPGYSPAAGHIDDHGSPERAAVDEVSEEIGVTIAVADLHPTVIHKRRINNVCRREGGDHHVWYVYEAVVGNEVVLVANEDQARSASWLTQTELDTLAARTALYKAGGITEEEWQENPGMEPIWVDFMTELGYVKGE